MVSIQVQDGIGNVSGANVYPTFPLGERSLGQVQASGGLQVVDPRYQSEVRWILGMLGSVRFQGREDGLASRADAAAVNVAPEGPYAPSREEPAAQEDQWKQGVPSAPPPGWGQNHKNGVKGAQKRYY